MSNALQPKPRIITPRARVSIVAAKYNETFTDALLENAMVEINELIPHARVDVIRVPGAFEVPVMVAQVIERTSPDCVIALGLLIRGSTAHADLVAESVTHALQEIAVSSRIPVIHEVLLCEDEKQAYARCIGEQLNRGRESARAAATMINVVSEFNRSIPRHVDPKR